MSVIDEINVERLRQIHLEGFDHAHDRQHRYGELVQAAIAYLIASSTTLRLLAEGHIRVADIVKRYASIPVNRMWPWEKTWWKPRDPRRDLIKAAALIVAEIERIDANALMKEKT